MANKSKKPVRLPKKTCWHLYSLQALQADKLIQIINKVLKREFTLVK